MNKTDQLLLKMEHPHNYTADEWQQILEDEECRELYTLMAKTRSAFDANAGVSDEEVDAEWKRLESETSKVRSVKLIRIAASFVGLLLVSGIAFAAFHIIHQRQHTDVQPTADTVVAANVSLTTPHRSIPEDSVSVQSLVFDNVTLDSIARDLAAYYHVELEVRNQQAGRLRFYFVWNQNDGLQEVIEKLNMFEQVNMTIENGKLTVK